ncbi:hypothetical protein [Microbacterium sp. p3-SID131]|uniref:hypothetical protein n=1 Tax=Microbacterium sp. p3-SID131 TaxID=2916215 RepID=UPI0021A5B34D|nr:hypothetical protein [Microbacterium sp. p3-SID131]MCT1363973.1 hypothetical protein [Microbacterium sp. p3-SID131]
MTITSVGYAGTITDSNWRRMATAAVGSLYGVDDFTSFRVTAGPGDRALAIADGGAFGLGVRDESDTPIVLNGDPVASGSRWDLVVLRRDWNAKETTPLIIAGSPTKALPDRYTGWGTMNDQPLALVRFAAGQSTAQEIVDLRCIPADAGVVAFDPLTLSYLDRVGTQVRIGDTLWTRTVNATGSPLWVSTDLTDTGWVNVPLGPKWVAVSGYPLRVRRIGPVAYLRGAVKAGSGAGYESLGTVPTLFRPTATAPLGATVTQSKAYGEMFVTTTGLIYISDEYRSGSNPVNNVVMVHGTWPVG